VKTVFKWWSTLLIAAVIVQIGFAGYGAFFVAGKEEDPGDFVTHKQFEDGWNLHSGFGYIVVLGGLIAFVLALLARLGRPRVLLSLGVALLFVLQVVLAWIGSGAAAVGALHPINAVVLAGLTGMIAGRCWRESRRPVGSSAGGSV
jgi:hypothetical protein